jgi:hypothetical protein
MKWEQDDQKFNRFKKAIFGWILSCEKGTGWVECQSSFFVYVSYSVKIWSEFQSVLKVIQSLLILFCEKDDDQISYRFKTFLRMDPILWKMVPDDQNYNQFKTFCGWILSCEKGDDQSWYF